MKNTLDDHNGPWFVLYIAIL